MSATEELRWERTETTATLALPNGSRISIYPNLETGEYNCWWHGAPQTGFVPSIHVITDPANTDKRTFATIDAAIERADKWMGFIYLIRHPPCSIIQVY